MVEMSIIIMLLLSTTFAVVDIGFALWQFNSADKATQIAVRAAIVSDPVADGLQNYDCMTATAIPGTWCSDPAAQSFGTVVCEGKTASCTGGFAFSTITANEILAKINGINGAITMDNVVFEYEDLRLGFAGRGAPIAAVTVRLVDMNFEFLLLDAFIAGSGPISMPDFRSTLSTEDLSSAG
jgi:Flp pilus assembly protein TadG